MKSQPVVVDTERIGKSLTAFVHGGFVLAGAVTVLLGTILPLLAARWSLSDSQTADFFPAQYLGAILGVVVSSFTIPKGGYRIGFLTSFALIAVGVGTVTRGSHVETIGSIFCYGTGLGFLSAVTNLWTAEAKERTRAGSLNLVNLSWTVGAMGCPLLVLLFASHASVGNLFLTLATVSALLAFSCFPLPLDIATAPRGAKKDPSSEGESLFSSRAKWIFAAIFFLEIGSENAVGGWLATYSKRILASSSGTWVITPSLFWGGLALGRALAPLALRKLSEVRVVQLGLVISILGTLTWLESSGAAGIYSGAVISGFGLSVIFPIMMAWLVEHFGVDARRVGGQMLGIGILGGGLIPWTIGMLSTHSGSLREGIAIIFPILLFNLVLFTFLPRMLNLQAARGEHV